ncbi:M16 family metallopeptidase [Fulvivirga lutimaris]|uniref:M16 family metallopeptidase n=1 Tax=Fulvivirga lutimaris TaxID=1819566 RepID=UPI001FE75267|nr:M16 family metallopeptidase [Fulvivirga lutimaris]
MKRCLSVLAIFLFVLTGLVNAQEKEIKGSLNSPLPTDPNVVVGKLDNGMTYYIRKNEKPEDKVELRLVVNVGSTVEDENQLGLAHFLEHMAFNGTKNFEKNELVDYLQSVGVKFGADLNAYTSFDETVYILPIPSDNEETLNKGLLVLEDWAHNITLSDEEIDKERGVVIEEWRLGQGANQRMRDEWFPVMFKDSRYANRLPIGKKEVLESFDYETIRKFYKDWYRPDLMSLVVVGDIDPAAMEKKIKAQFSKIKNPKNPRERTFYDVPDQDNTAVSVVTDPEASFTQIQLIYKQDNEETKTLDQYRRDIVYNLYSGMITKRLDELKQSPEPPFFFASTSYGSMVRTKSNYSSFAVVGENGVENGLNALVTENERVKKFGFTEGELDRYKADMLNRMEKAYKEADKTESQNYASEYIRNFLSNEPIPGIAFEYDFYKKVLPTITVEEVNALAKKWISNSNRVVVITGPEKEGVVMPTEEEVKKILFKAQLAKITPYDDGTVGAELLEEKPTAGKIASRKELETVGATELTLSNGVKVVLKPTDFKNDEILMRAYSPGGQSIYPDADDKNASFASQIINESGVGEFTVTDLQKMMSGKTVRVNPFISNLTEGISGNAAPKDLETMLQMVYLYFTNPRKDEKSFESFKSKNKMLLGNLMSNPQFYFSDQVSRILTQDHPRGGGFPTPEDLDAINFERSFEIYQDRFADASDFTFLFVGNFNISEISPLLESYLGGLPSTSREETWKDLGIRPPSGKVEKVVNKGTDQKSSVNIVFTDKTKYTKEDSYNIRTLGELLSIKLIEILREEKGGVYGVGASGSISKYPYENYTFRIQFPCGPENVDDLVKATFDEIEKIKKEGVSEEDINKLKETQRKERKDNLKENQYWLNSLYGYYFNDYDLSGYYEYEKQIEALTSKDLQEAAKKYLPADEYIKIVLMPEESDK